MANELTPASWSSLEPSRRAALFSSVTTRADQVLSVANIRHLTEEQEDGYFPAAIAAMERKLLPAGEDAAREAISLACQILRCRHPEGDMLLGYTMILAEFPRDLLMPSIKLALEKETHHVLPTPGALVTHARVRRNERVRALFNARLAYKRLQIAADWKARGIGSC